MGGSYGGYMSGIMAARHADVFKSAILMNPCLNLPFMMNITGNSERKDIYWEKSSRNIIITHNDLYKINELFLIFFFLPPPLNNSKIFQNGSLQKFLTDKKIFGRILQRIMQKCWENLQCWLLRKYPFSYLSELRTSGYPGNLRSLTWLRLSRLELLSGPICTLRATIIWATHLALSSMFSWRL